MAEPTQKPARSNKGFIGKLVEYGDLALSSKIEELKKSAWGDPLTNIPYRKALVQDPDKRNSQYGYKPKYSLLPDQTKLLIYIRSPIVAAIIQTRINQIAEFSRPQKDKYSSGFTFGLKDETDIETLSPEAQEEVNAEIEMLNNFILNCGLVDEEREEAEELMDFETFLKLIVKDRLIYDQLCIERIPTKKGDVLETRSLHHFLPVSAASVRFATRNLDPKAINDMDQTASQDAQIRYNKDRHLNGEYKYVQVVGGQIRRGFTKDELVMRFGNPINDFFTNGYSVGELDLLVSVMTTHLNLDRYNKNLFENGITAPGIINLKGEIDEEMLEAFRRAYYAQGIGPDAMLRTPVINNPEGVEFVKMSMSEQDMNYRALADYLIKVICAVYQIAPEEINFASSSKNESGGGGGGGSNYNNIEKRIKVSRNRGLKPVLRMVENTINHEILPYLQNDWDWVEKYEFKFVGFDAESRKDELDRQEKEVKTFKSVNEIRKEHGLDPIEGADDLILDGTYFQWYTQFSKTGQALAQKNAGMMGGQPGQPGGDPNALPFEDQDPIMPDDGSDGAAGADPNIDQGDEGDIDSLLADLADGEASMDKKPTMGDEEAQQPSLPFEEEEEEEHDLKAQRHKLPFEKSLKKKKVLDDILTVEIYKKRKKKDAKS